MINISVHVEYMVKTRISHDLSITYGYSLKLYNMWLAIQWRLLEFSVLSDFAKTQNASYLELCVWDNCSKSDGRLETLNPQLSVST